MTVKELKEILKMANDDADVYVDDGDVLHWDLQATIDTDGDVAIEQEGCGE